MKTPILKKRKSKSKPKSRSYSPPKNKKSGNYAKVKKGGGRGKAAGGGMTAKGVKAYNKKTGGNLKTAVTTPPSKLKKGSKAAKRRKSFCARMSGNKGPMKDEKGRPTRKAMSLRRWKC